MSRPVTTALRMTKDDAVVTAWAEAVSGPGWANAPIRVLVHSSQNARYRVEYLQPGEQTTAMHTLYQVSQEAHLAMTKAVEAALWAEGKEEKPT